MRILLLTEFFPRSHRAEITGGVEARCFYVSRELEKRHHVKVLAVRTDGEAWDHATLGSLPRRVRFAVSMLLGALRSRCDVIEGSNHLVHPIAWLAGRLRRKPVVHYYPDVLIGSWRDVGSAGWLGEIVERISLRWLRADHYVTTSHAVIDKLRARGIPEDRISLIPCGVEDELLDHVIARSAEQEQGATLSVVARLVRYKGVHVVLDAVAELARRGRRVTVSIVGQGPEEQALRDQAARLGIADQVTFHGHVTAHVDVLHIMGASRVFVTASTVEGFGIVVAEAMALGVPYVAGDIPTFVEVTGSGVGGMLFRSGDARHLADCIARLLDDDALYRRSAEEGQAWSQRYRWADIAQRTEAVYAALVQGRPVPVSAAQQANPAVGEPGAVLNSSTRMTLVDGARRIALTTARTVVPTAWRPRLFQVFEDTRFFRSLHGEARVIESELARDGATPWTAFADRGQTAHMSERVVEVPWVLTRLGRPHRVLDIGSVFAPRVYTRALVARGIAELHGLDLAAGEVPGIRMTQADIRRMPFEDEFFDAAVCISTLEHIGHDNTRYALTAPSADEGGPAALREIARVLRAGGRALITVPFGRYKVYDWFTQYDLPTWQALVEAAGLREAERDIYRLGADGWLRCNEGELPSGLYKENGAPAATAVLLAVLERPAAR